MQPCTAVGEGAQQSLFSFSCSFVAVLCILLPLSAYVSEGYSSLSR